MGRATGLLLPPKLARTFSSALLKRFSPKKQVASKSRVRSPIALRAESKSNRMEEASGSDGRVPLSEVVSDCVKRWFVDTFKEAKAGDSAMQILLGQMYCNGYGVTKDVRKGRACFTKASQVRSSVWKVSKKRPGYNASDSDSDDTKVDAE
ncbi:unnamed protein product [Rhodiola kirilowii]